MTLAETLKQDLKIAMKAKDSATLSTLRLLLSAVKNKQIDLQHELSDEEIQAVIKTQVKQLKDAVITFREGDRPQLADDSEVEIGVLEKYLPAQMSDDELSELLSEVVKESGVESKADIGKVMGLAMQKVAGRADGGRVKNIIMTLLPSLVLVALGTLLIPTLVHAGGIPIISDSQQASDAVVVGLRATRVLVLWFGISAITLILNAGFMYMTASFRDDSHSASMAKLSRGVFVTIIVASLFSLSTIILNHIEY
jgi:uncharacterized protein